MTTQRHPRVRRAPLHPLFKEWLRKRWHDVPDIVSRVAARYEVTLQGTEVDTWSKTEHYHFLMTGRGGRVAPYVEWYDIDKRDDAWLLEHHAEDTIRVYDAPHGRPRYSIPWSRTLAYRGMSWEEWQSSKTRGYMKSAGHYNFDFQREWTCFSSDPGTAEHYASSFAPWPFQPGPTTPGIVVAIDRAHTQRTPYEGYHRPRGPAHVEGTERFCLHRVAMSEVRAVWALIATKTKSAKLEIMRDPRFGWKHDHYGTSPAVDYTTVRLLP